MGGAKVQTAGPPQRSYEIASPRPCVIDAERAVSTDIIEQVRSLFEQHDKRWRSHKKWTHPYSTICKVRDRDKSRNENVDQHE